MGVREFKGRLLTTWKGAGQTERLVALLLVVFLLRLVAAIAAPLIDQETYHWAYAMHPDLSYFDHPPLVAWAIAAGVGLLGIDSLGIRLFTLLFALITTAVGLALIRDLGGTARAQRLWLIATVAIPIFGFGMNLAMTEGPLLCGWMLAVWALWRARGEGLGWWLLAGLGAGVALLGKYTAVFLLPGGVLLLATDGALRRQVRRPGPWLALLVAGVCFSPVVVWNAHHGWASFLFQATSRSRSSVSEPIRVLEMIGGQLVVLTPMTAVAIAVAAGWWCKRWNGDPRALWILGFGVPLPALMAVISPWVLVKLNWMAPAYLTLVIGAVLWFTERDIGERFPAWTAAGRCIAWSMSVVLLFSPAAYLLPADWGNNWSGRRDIASAAEAWEDRIDGVGANEGRVFFFSHGGNESAALWYSLYRVYAENTPLEAVIAQNSTGEPALAFDYWTLPDTLAGKDAVCVLMRRSGAEIEGIVARMRRYFDSVDMVEDVEVSRLGVVVRTASIWVCRNYRPQGADPGKTAESIGPVESRAIGALAPGSSRAVATPPR